MIIEMESWRHFPSLEELTKRGYFVLRMGSKVKDKLNTNNPKILDYANMEIRSDFRYIF